MKIENHSVQIALITHLCTYNDHYEIHYLTIGPSETDLYEEMNWILGKGSGQDHLVSQFKIIYVASISGYKLWFQMILRQIH